MHGFARGKRGLVFAAVCGWSLIASSARGDCPAVPRDCRTAQRSLLQVKGGRKLVWRWIHGQATSTLEIANPTTSSEYSFCVYAGQPPVLIGATDIPPDGLKWAPLGSRGYKYLDRTLAAAGVQKIVVTGADSDGDARAFVSGTGPNLPDLGLPLALPVTAQLVNVETGVCWEGTYDAGDVVKNQTSQFEAKMAVPPTPGGPTPTPGPPAPSLALQVSNLTGVSANVTFSGQRLSGPDPAGLPTSYSRNLPALVSGETPVAIDGPLAPGIWLHAVSVPGTGQQQYQQTLVVTDPSASSPVEWTLFAAVLQVNRDDDGGDGTCDSTCTLRDAVQTANGSTGPVLIQFDHTAGIAHAAVTGNAAVAITAPNTMIDGTDAAGNPSPLGDLAARTYPTVVDLAASNPGGVPSGSCPCTESPGGALRVQAESVRLRGLSLERQLPPQICCGDEDMVAFDTGSKSSRIETCRLDGGAAAIASAEVAQGQTGPPSGKDCVDADTTGATAAEPVVVENSELRFCHDRGVKSRQGFVSLQRNWIHHNLRGGVFAQSPDVGTTPGIVEAIDNLIERNGLNCPTGDPSACGPEHVTRADASEISLQGAFTQVLSTGNTLRDGVAQGLYFQDQSKGTVTDTYVCGIKNQSDGTGTGIVVQKTRGATSDIVVRGSAAVYNGDAGVKFFANVAADVGKDTGAGVGRNAFTENGTQPGRNVVNLLDTPAPVIEAHGNQWQHCYPAGHLDANTCDDTAVGNGDTNNAPGQSNKVRVTNSQPHGQTGKPVITAVTPTKAATGDVVRISGSLFDAISGQTGGAGGDCRDLTGGNTCHPLSGTCVEFQVDGEWVEALDVIAVTPTSITARSPLTCSGPSAVRVRRRKLSTQGQLTPQVISNNAPFCHN